MNSSTSNSRALIGAFLIACAAVFALLLASSEWLVRAEAAPQDTLLKHIALFERTHSPYTAFGDSHVARGFNAAAPVVNLAYPSENIEKMAWKAKLYLDRTPHPQTVLIQADAHLFASYRVDAGLEDYPDMFSDARQRGGLLALSARYRPQLIALWRAFFKNGGRLQSTIETTPQGALLSPGNLARWSAAEADQFTKDRVALHQPQPDFLHSQTARLYRSMIDDFVGSGARVCLVAMPVSPLYRDAIAGLPVDEKRLWNEAETFFHKLAERPQVRFIDHRAQYDDLSLFRDPDHLNREGALRYGPVLQDACFAPARDDDETPTAVASTAY